MCGDKSLARGHISSKGLQTEPLSTLSSCWADKGDGKEPWAILYHVNEAIRSVLNGANASRTFSTVGELLLFSFKLSLAEIKHRPSSRVEIWSVLCYFRQPSDLEILCFFPLLFPAISQWLCIK